MSTITDPPTKPGIYRNLPDAVYRAIPAVSQSTLKRFADCPQKFKLAPPIDVTANMIYGSLLDALWLTGDMEPFAVQPATYPGVDRKKQPCEKKWNNSADHCSLWCEQQEAAGKTIVTAEMWHRAMDAKARLNGIPEIREAREACDIQVAVVAEIEGILCKALIDLCPRDGVRRALGDLKTAPSADPQDWPRYAYKMRLHWQAAMYLDVWNAASGETLEAFFHFVSEQEAPHEPATLALSDTFIGLGRDQYRRALRHYDECRKTDTWPGYPVNAVVYPEKWMLRGDNE